MSGGAHTVKALAPVVPKAAPIVSTQAIERVLLRLIPSVSAAREATGEHLLVVAVIRQAFSDCCLADKHIRREAMDFLRGHGGALEFWCSAVGINAEFVREMAEKAGYLPAVEGVHT
jgi:hypothetical protein